MTKRLIASSLAAAFAFGTAFGLAVSRDKNTNCTKPNNEMLLDDFGNSSPRGSSQMPAAPEKQSNGFACLKDGYGETLCWPKGSEPGADSESACAERDGTTLCATKPKLSPPKLDL
jgi:hypothetical protein